jgi:Protein of unknown function (DUF3225)
LIINNPETHAQLTAAFADYERALMENDIATLDALFWDSPMFCVIESARISMESR